MSKKNMKKKKKKKKIQNIGTKEENNPKDLKV